MQIAIVFQRETGNTRKIAEAVREGLEGQEIVYFGEPREDIEADLYLVGSWTDKGNCAQPVGEFLGSLRNRKIGWFGTAGFGGSPAYYQKLYSRVAEQVGAGCQILGFFYCQGRMPHSVRERYEKMLREHPEDRRMQVSIENFDRAQSHPDEVDCGNARQWARQMAEKAERQLG